MFDENPNMQIDFRDGVSDPYNQIAQQLIDSYKNTIFTKTPQNTNFVIGKEIEEIITLLLGCLHPGLHSSDFTWLGASSYVSKMLESLQNKLSKSMHFAVYLNSKEIADFDYGIDCNTCNTKAMEFLMTLPKVLSLQCSDIEAAYDGDPSARMFEEIVLSYPGILAITVYRLAHELHNLDVPLLPRMMTEWAHSKTGIDIHPGAKVGTNFFIDHGTGVVIGETVVIGNNVKLYQGVTLGAISIPQNSDRSHQQYKTKKRHPTVQDNVTIYANATVLGGSTIIEKNCVVGSSAFIYESVPTGSTVKAAKLNHEIVVNNHNYREFLKD